MRFRIQHLTGSKAGQEQVVEARVVRVGRDPANELAFDPYTDVQVSTFHAQIMVLDNGQVLLSDLKSRNGTFLNGQRVTSAVPLSTGSEVVFGEDGPKVKIAIEPAAAPAPAEAAGAAATPVAAAPAPKKGKGCLIAFVLFAVLGMCVFLGGIAAWLALSPAQMAESDTAPTEPVEVSSPPEEPAEEAPPPEEPAVVAEKKHPWANYGPGTSFTTQSTTEMDVGGNKMKTEATTQYTLVSITDDVAKVKLDTTAMGNTTTSEMEVPLRLETTGEAQEQPEMEERSESVEVPAGTFDATYRKTTSEQGGQETVSETWMDDDVPVPFKMVIKNPTMTSTTVMTAMEKK